jgi:hypothetical protein
MQLLYSCILWSDGEEKGGNPNKDVPEQVH